MMQCDLVRFMNMRHRYDETNRKLMPMELMERGSGGCPLSTSRDRASTTPSWTSLHHSCREIPCYGDALVSGAALSGVWTGGDALCTGHWGHVKLESCVTLASACDRIEPGWRGSRMGCDRESGTRCENKHETWYVVMTPKLLVSWYSSEIEAECKQVSVSNSSGK